MNKWIHIANMNTYFLNIATQQTSKNQCKIKKYSQCSGFRSKHADFRSENAEYRSGLEDTARDYRSESFFYFFECPNSQIFEHVLY